MKFIIVSGRSGSGKSVTLRVLEDLGFYCVDNIPINLLPSLTHVVMTKYENIAVSIDVRNIPMSASELSEILDYLPSKMNVEVIYLDAEDSALVRRYSETRRLHPLSKQNMSLLEAIQNEKELLDPIATRASLYIDTTEYNVHQLTEMVKERVLGKKSAQLSLVFESFGFKHGIPKDADYVFDVRFLPNPHWEPELKPLTGQDQGVKDYLNSHPIVAKFTWQVNNFLSTWLPHIERNNRSYLTVAIGCTGGQHRSVFVAESLANSYAKLYPSVQVRHRELNR
ncbi:MAG: UPF0042 nucleotide-binding protein [Phenylobacterium sp.]